MEGSVYFLADRQSLAEEQPDEQAYEIPANASRSDIMDCLSRGLAGNYMAQLADDFDEANKCSDFVNECHLTLGNMTKQEREFIHRRAMAEIRALTALTEGK